MVAPHSNRAKEESAMKQGMESLTALADRIENLEKAKADYVADTRHVEMAVKRPPVTGEKGEVLRPATMGLSIADTPGQEMTVQKHAHGQIAARLKIPAPYYRRMQEEAPELLAHNVNAWFQDKPERRMVRTLASLHNGGAPHARAFLSDRYCRIDNHEVAHAALPIVMDLGERLGLKVASCDVTDSRLYLKFVTERVQAEIGVGDVVQQGLVISNSEIGLGALKVEPMVFRLVCLNGMISGRALAKYHVGKRADEELHGLLSDQTKKLEDAATLGKVRDVVAACMDGTIFEENVAALREATEDKVEGDPAKAVEILGKTIGLTQAEQPGLLRHLIEGSDLSRYGMVQAVTRLSQDVESYDRATELEQAGGHVLTLPDSQWREIKNAA